MHLPSGEIAAAVRRLAGLLRPGGTLYLTWRVTSDADRRDPSGRLYSSFGPDLVPPFETLWYAHATLAPVDPAQEEQLLPFTQYMRQRGREVTAEQLIQAHHTNFGFFQI